MGRPPLALSFLLIPALLYLAQAHLPPPRDCQEAGPWTLNGRALVQDYRGRPLVVTFVSLGHCDAECDLELKRLDSLIDRQPDFRVLAIAPKEEEPSLVRAFARRFPRIRFEHESPKAPVWAWFGAGHEDQFIFDRCSRLLVTNLSGRDGKALFRAKTALGLQRCGYCEFDWSMEPPIWPSSLHPPPPAAKGNVDGQLEEDWRKQERKRTQKKETVTVGGLLAAAGITNNGVGRRSNARQIAAFAEQQENFVQNGQQRDWQGRTIAVHRGQQQEREQEQQRQKDHLMRPTGDQQKQKQQKRMEKDESSADIARREQRERELQKQKQQYEERMRQYWAQRHRMEQQQRAQGNAQNQQGLAHRQQQEPTQRREQLRRNDGENDVSMQPNGQREPPGKQGGGDAGTIPIIRYAKDPFGDRYQYGLSQAQSESRSEQMSPSRGLSSRGPDRQAAGGEPARSALPEVPVGGPNGTTGVEPQPPDPAPLYPEGSEIAGEDYYGDEYAAEWTTTEAPSPQMQIPVPTKAMAPTIPTPQAMDKSFGFELPCTGFTDESCYQQQTQLRPNEVHRCCRGRILFTDQCVAGKCSNMSAQLCCIQKFLQAKMTCCSDERQAETEVGDHFSHCCFDNFVDNDDTCCPRTYAIAQWRSVHELCLPNVEIDLSRIKVPTPLLGTSLVTEFDFGKTDKWRFECRYGSHVQQYSFFEESTSGETEEEHGDEEKAN